MSAAGQAAPPWSGTMTLLAVSARGLARTGRTLVLTGIVSLPVIVAVGQRLAGQESSSTAYADLLGQLVVPTVIAFVALILASSAISDDREDGTILLVVASSIPRIQLVAAKAAAAWIMAMCLVMPALVATAALLGQVSPKAIGWPLLAAALVSAAYAGVFSWVSLVTRRAIVVGAAYVLLWEGTFATFAGSADRFSIAAYGRRVVAVGVPGTDAPDVGLVAAVVVLVVVGLTGLALAGRAIRRVELP